MQNLYLVAASAFWLGILTSISPCPLATNIAAVSFISKKISKPSLAFLSGSLYTLGRTLAYIIIGFLLVKSIMNSQTLSLTLQTKMNVVIGPLLIITGLILLDIFQFSFSGTGTSEKLQKTIEKMGLWGSFLLGFIFALSFCPFSTAIFFGSLLPMAVNQQSAIVIPTAYGIATGIPVLVFSVILASSTKKVATFFNKVSSFEKIARQITAAIFIGVGMYLSVVYIF